MDNRQPSGADWAIVAGGAVAFIGSFPDSVGSTSAWGTGAFPILTLVPVYCLIVAGMVALTTFAGASPPARVLGFRTSQLYVVLGVFASVMAICWYAAVSPRGFGLYLMIGGSIAVAVGAIKKNAS